MMGFFAFWVPRECVADRNAPRDGARAKNKEQIEIAYASCWFNSVGFWRHLIPYAHAHAQFAAFGRVCLCDVCGRRVRCVDGEVWCVRLVLLVLLLLRRRRRRRRRLRLCG